MASPVVLSFDELKTLVAFAERGAKLGILKIPEHLQPFIDKPKLFQRFVRWADAGMPEFPAIQSAPVQAPVVVFQDPDSHRVARDIMGEKNFHGIAAAQRRFGAYSEVALEQRKKIRLFDEKANDFLTEEETLVVLRKHKDTHILVATHETDIVSLHASHKDRFSNDAKPWFAKAPEKKWSSAKITVPWLLVRKEVVDQSWGQDVDAQKEHVATTLPNERQPLPCEYTYAALLHYLEIGQKLCFGYWIRFAVQDADGHWVNVNWNGDQLHVRDWYRDAGVNVASASVWASR